MQSFLYIGSGTGVFYLPFLDTYLMPSNIRLQEFVERGDVPYFLISVVE